jgi:hypothetical protein
MREGDAMGGAIRWARALAGAVLGGVLGYYAFFWIARQGYYALALPGALLGAGCGLTSSGRSAARGAACAVAGLALGLVISWQFDHPRGDPSLLEYTRHLTDTVPVTQIMIAAGGLGAFWFGRDSLRGVGRTPRPIATPPGTEAPVEPRR